MSFYIICGALSFRRVGVLRDRASSTSAVDQVRWKRAIATGPFGLLDKLAREFRNLLPGGQGGEPLAGIHLPGRRDRLDARTAAHVRARKPQQARHGILNAEHRTGKERDP